MKGNVKFFNDMKGFGFIAGDDGTEYFVHTSGIKAGVTLRENDAVSFDIEQGDRGPKAVNVTTDVGAEESAPAEEESSEEEAPAEEESSEDSEEAEEDSEDEEKAE